MALKKYSCVRLCEDCQKPVTADRCPKCLTCTNESRRKYVGWNDRWPLGAGYHTWTGAIGGGGKRNPMAKVDGRNQTVRRLIWEALVGSLRNNEYVRDTCGNHHCIFINHLAVGNGKTGEIRRSGDRYYDDEGYVWIVQERGAAITEHKLVMQQHLERELVSGKFYENVHHINGVKDDNRIENLELWAVYPIAGQRVRDMVEWAQEILNKYEKEVFEKGL